MPSIVCQRCRQINEASANTCQSCGARFCPSCHFVIDSPNASVCPHCGKKDLTFRPGKYGAGAAAPSAEIMPGKTVCSSCGNKIDSSARKCPYCGQLGQRQSVSPAAGSRDIISRSDDRMYGGGSLPQAESAPSRQLYCQKCGSPVPPGSSMCPRHGKYGILVEGQPSLPGRYTGELWGKVIERRAASAEAAQVQPRRQTPPQEIYPQMRSGQTAPTPDMPAMPAAADQRACPQCGAAVPDRSKICPNCGWNRLPRESTKPIPRAEEFYKAREGAAAGGQPYATYMADQQQPYAAYVPDQQQYYGQPAVQPYEMAYQPAPSMGMDIPYEDDRKKRKAKKPRIHDDYREAPRARQSILPLLLALIAIGAVIVLGVMFILDQMKTPRPAVLPPAVTPPSSAVKAPVISSISYKDITRTTAVVTWKTDKKSNSIVVYCLDGGSLCENAKDDVMVTEHSVKLTGLEPDKTYHITVKSRLDNDPNSPDATLEHTQVLRTGGVADTTPPKITKVNTVNIVSSATTATATITWVTDEPATSQVSYGTSVSYGTLQPMSSDTNLSTYHEVQLSGLPIQTTLHYKVISRDADGNEASSPDATFVTPAAAGTSIGSMAPDFTLMSGTDGANYTLSSLRGKKVIVNFWSLQCPYCDAEMPYFDQVQENNSNVVVLAICGPQMTPVNNAVVGDKLTQGNWSFQVLLDPTGAVGSTYNVNNGVPVTYFVDSNGVIKAYQNGSFPNLAALEAKLNSY